jgi:hypothetical protein
MDTQAAVHKILKSVICRSCSYEYKLPKRGIAICPHCGQRRNWGL